MFWKKWFKKKKSLKNSITVGMKITSCQECSKFNMGVEIHDVFSWGLNPSFAMGYDKQADEILLAEEQLMRIIQMVNPVQQPRKIRIVSQEDIFNNQNWKSKQGE